MLTWEIFAWGVKPWVGVPNQEVCGRIESGERPKVPYLEIRVPQRKACLQKTSDCPEALYDFLVHHTWAFEAHKRPVMSEVCENLKTILPPKRHSSDNSNTARDAGAAEALGAPGESARLAQNFGERAESALNARTQIIQGIPVIRTNIDSLPNLTLWRTMEEQRRQVSYRNTLKPRLVPDGIQ